MNKVLLYYSHNSLSIEMEEFFQKRLIEMSIPVVSVIKNARTDFAASFATKNIIFQEKSKNNWDSILRQIQVGTEYIMDTFGNVMIYLVEHDVLYHPTYFLEHDSLADNVILKNMNLYFLTSNGYIGPYNSYIHSQTIITTNTLQACLTEDVTRHRKFKTQSFYRLMKYNSNVSSIDVRHGKNITGPRFAKKYLTNLDYWGNWNDLWKTIPIAKLTV